MRITKNAKFGMIFVLSLLIGIGALAAFRHAGRWLVCENPLSRADVIVVLSGGLPFRADEGAKVFALGYAPEVWVSRPARPAGDLEKRGVHFVGEEEYDRQVLVFAGVPQEAVHILPDTVVNTEQEVQEIGREMRRTGKTKVIIVTSPQHTRRVKALWKRLVGAPPHALVHAAPEDPFDRDHWWGNTRDILSVVREVLGLINVWAGLPVPPQAN
jgi:uncharacterized SAM-binding protein YcdF (DUF218 family)